MGTCCTEKPKTTQETKSAKPTTASRPHFGQSTEVDSILRSQKIQMKSTVNTAGDIYEQEADAVAGQIMRTAAPEAVQSSRQTEVVQNIQRKTNNGVQGQTAPPIVDRVSNSPGQPLDAATLAFMESRFGEDFSRVRVHTDALATQAADALQARAYTAGRNIVFADGQYQPASTEGRHLLAHELTHVVQQGEGASNANRRIVQRQPSPATAPPQLTQQLYSQAITSIASRSGVNSRLLAILRQGQVGQTVAGVHSASSTLQISIPAPSGSTGAATSAPAVRLVFDLRISPTTSVLPAGAFAAFNNDPANQTAFTGNAASGQAITRLLEIITKAPTGTNAPDTLGEALVHEGTHMLLAIDDLISQANIPGLSAGLTGAQTSFSRYLTAATSSSRRSALITSLLAEVNRVFTPSGATSPTISSSAANQAVENVIVRMLEERFAVDQQVAAYPRIVPNTTLAGAYLWDLLADETPITTWPQGTGAQALVTAMALFLDDIAAQLSAPSSTPGAGTTPTPTTPPPSTPNKKP